MKKVNWSSSLVAFCILFCGGCSGPESGSNANQTENTQRLMAPNPSPTPDTFGVHDISYDVMKMLADDYRGCNCEPNMDSIFFGSFIDTASVMAQLNKSDIEGVYLHLGLTSQNEFYIALSGATGLGDSTLIAEADYPIGTDGYVFDAASFDSFMDSETFKNPSPGELKGSAITADRQRFASELRCDINGDNVVDSLSTVPFGYMKRNELELLIEQCSAPYLAFIMGYDPTMYPSVMRVIMLSTQLNGGSEIKLVKMDPNNSAHYGLFLDRYYP
jgi:hypothetical protein